MVANHTMLLGRKAQPFVFFFFFAQKIIQWQQCLRARSLIVLVKRLFVKTFDCFPIPRKTLDFSFCPILTLEFLTISGIVFTAFKVSEFKGYPLTCRVRLHLMLQLSRVLHSMFCSNAPSHLF